MAHLARELVRSRRERGACLEPGDGLGQHADHGPHSVAPTADTAATVQHGFVLVRAFLASFSIRLFSTHCCGCRLRATEFAFSPPV